MEGREQSSAGRDRSAEAVWWEGQGECEGRSVWLKGVLQRKVAGDQVKRAGGDGGC